MPRVQIDIVQEEQAEEQVDPLVFVIDGQDYQAQSELSEFALLDLAQKATSSDVMEAGAAFMTFMESLLEPGDWQRFRDAAIKNKWKSDQLLPLVQTAVEYMVGVPTSPPSESPAGQPTTGTQSRVISLSEGGTPTDPAA